MIKNQNKDIRIPLYMYQKLSDWRNVAIKLTQKLKRKPDMFEISKHLKISRKQMKYIQRAMQILSFQNNDENMQSLDNMAMPDKEEKPEFNITNPDFKTLFKCLTPREKEAIELKFGLYGNKPKTLSEIAKIFSLSKERIRQIIAHGLKEMKFSRQIKEKPKYKYFNNNKLSNTMYFPQK